jgi:C-terminal processing protease CtpA/Prc
MPPAPPLPAALTPRAQALARSLDIAATAASARPEPRSCTFGEGPLGLSLADYGDVVVVANEPAPGSQAHANGILRLSVVVGLNHENVSGLPKDAVVEKVKACGRPLTLQFLPPNSRESC